VVSRLVIQAGALDAALADLAIKGIAAGPPRLPGGAGGPRTSWVTDPDGYRIELVQWPATPTA
jgi:lactoylglutathione lyase